MVDRWDQIMPMERSYQGDGTHSWNGAKQRPWKEERAAGSSHLPPIGFGLLWPLSSLINSLLVSGVLDHASMPTIPDFSSSHAHSSVLEKKFFWKITRRILSVWLLYQLWRGSPYFRPVSFLDPEIDSIIRWPIMLLKTIYEPKFISTRKPEP